MTEAEELDLVAKHEAEVARFRREQLERDGRIYDEVLAMWRLRNGKLEAPAWAGEKAEAET